MKIALVILHADPKRGGAERYTADITQALAGRGHEVSVVASDFPDDYLHGHLGTAAHATHVERVEIKGRGMTRVGQYQSFLDSLDEHLANNSYDVVHAMLPVRRCDLYHPHAGIAAGAPGGWKGFFNPRRMEMAEVERRLLKAAEPPVVLILSDYVKQFVKKHYAEFPEKKLVKLFNAVDLERFKPAEEVKQGEAVGALIIAQD